MRKKEQYKKLLKLLAVLALVAVQTCMFSYVWFYCYGDVGANYFVRGNYIVIALYALMIIFFNTIYSGFRVGFLRLFEAVYCQILSVICVNVVTYFQLCLIGRWQFLTNLVPMIGLTVVNMIVAVVWVCGSKFAYTRFYKPEKMLLIYGEYGPDNLLRKIASRKDKYAIEEVFSIDHDISEIEEKILKYNNVLLTDISAELRNHILKFCFRHDISCYYVPKISDIMIQSAENYHLFDTTLLVCRNIGLTVEQQMIKRAFDLVVSLILIVVTLPLMLLIGICIKAYDGGPVFFTQDRLTQDGKIFKIIKFRSMRVQQENEVYTLTRKNDDRITPVGKILRATHFDELPQMYNILKGEMSIVGPRPECPKLAEEYSQIVPQFDYRLKVKAGLTGFAQVYGKYNTTPYDKLKLDLTYIERYSFLLDLKLILLTIKVLFQKENTEGIDDWQTNAATKENLEKIKQN